MVLCSHRSPNDCSITYCNREDEWLTNHDLQKLSLLKFDVCRHKQAKKTDNNVIEIGFSHYSLLMMFGSMSKLQEWLDALERIRSEFACMRITLANCTCVRHLPQDHTEDEVNYLIPFSLDDLSIVETMHAIKNVSAHTF